MGSKKTKTRVGLIFGGRSGEHEVSLRSARSVMAAIDHEKYEVVPIGITKEGHWTLGGVELLEMGDEPLQPAALLGDPSQRALMQVRHEGDQVTLSNVAELDLVFPILHGPYGEDGTMQGLLELAGLPYLLLLRSEWNQDPDRAIEQVESALDYPVFTKPANLGSSVGISKCDNRVELEAGLAEAARFDRRLVIEQGIDAREIECSVLGNDNPIASIAGEVMPSRDFYSYQAKYQDEGEDASGLLIPAPISDKMMAQVQAWAVQAYKAIDCAGLARVDFLLEKEGQRGELPRLFINEINTIPGFTSISMYPKLWKASGISYSELIDRLIELALERYEEKERTQISPDFL
jgi:D-alanine-D-alanine ligase